MKRYISFLSLLLRLLVAITGTNPVGICNCLSFSPSSTCKASTVSIHGLLLLTTITSADFLAHRRRTYSKTSPVRAFPLSIPVTSIYLPTLGFLGFTMMCLLTRTTMPHIPFTPFGREIASLSSVRQFRLVPVGLLQCLDSPNIAPAFS